MDEKDVTLFINCRNCYVAEIILKALTYIIKKENIKYKSFNTFRTLEIQIDNQNLFFCRIIDTEKEVDILSEQKYFISDLEFFEIYKDISKSNRTVFKNIFGNFIRGEF